MLGKVEVFKLFFLKIKILGTLKLEEWKIKINYKLIFHNAVSKLICGTILSNLNEKEGWIS